VPSDRLQHTKFEDIRKQYLLRASHNEPIVFRHNGIIVSSMNTIAELDTFADRVIAVEAIKDSDPSSRTSPAQRDPLEPLSNLAPANGGSVKSDMRIKPEPQDWSVNNENRVPSPKPPNACGISRLESSARLLGAKEDTPEHNTLSVGSQDYLTECAMRGFIHERITEALSGFVEERWSVGEGANIS
jgi:hypothetical protein